MKKTNKELYDYVKKKVDEANKPYITQPVFATLYEEARSEWMKAKIKDYETTEAVRRDLSDFDRSHTYSDGTVDAKLSDIEHLRYITAVHGDFTLSCDGENRVYTIPIVPMPKDKAFLALTDPFERPDDTEPFYIESSDTEIGKFLKILSSNPAKNLTVHYLKYPDAFDLKNNPAGFTEEGEAQQIEILHLVTEKYFNSIENFNSAAKERQEIINAGI